MHHFLSAHRIATMARGRGTFVIKIIAHPIGVEHLGGNKLPADVAQTVTESKFVTAIDAKAVGKRQRLTGFLDDRSLISAGNQERRNDEKEKCGSHGRFGVCSEIGKFRRRPNCSISGHPKSISKTSNIP